MTFWFCFHPTSGRFQEVGGQPTYRDPEKPDQSGPAQGMSVALFYFLDQMSIIEKMCVNKSSLFLFYHLSTF